ncbi:hypothetical protein BGX38DRAFT_1330155 [Terfezia claveryi]|nr:hypothetical protein BGX38DRAFT_1330155 [Terfezia claveryi]
MPHRSKGCIKANIGIESVLSTIGIEALDRIELIVASEIIAHFFFRTIVEEGAAVTAVKATAAEEAAAEEAAAEGTVAAADGTQRRREQRQRRREQRQRRRRQRWRRQRRREQRQRGDGGGGGCDSTEVEATAAEM